MRTKLHRPGPRPVAGLVLLVGTAAAIVVASAGAAIIRGTPKGDTLRGSAAADRLYGNSGSDRLYGLAGNDYLNGGPGNDLVNGGPGTDTLVCGPGRDTAVADAADKIGADCETVVGVPKAAVSVSGESLTEGATLPLTFTITLAQASPLKVSLRYETADGTAAGGSDYTATSGTLVFAPGETSKTIGVPIIDDAVVEPDETFTLALSNPVNAKLGTAQAIGTIENDDAAPAPRAGHYAGQTSQGKSISFDVGPDLISLANLSFGVLLVCQTPDGSGIVPNFGISFSEPWAIDSTSHWGGPFTVSGGAATGSGTISGAFDAAGHASGTLHVDVTIGNGALNCSSKDVSWTAQ